MIFFITKYTVFDDFLSLGQMGMKPSTIRDPYKNLI